MLEAYERRLRAAAGADCFIRRSRGDDALWASDLPRRLRDAEALRDAERRMNEAGALCRTDERACLWYIDLCGEKYAKLVGALPTEPPPIPRDDGLHAVYALCRLLLCHPAPLSEQPLAPLRAVLKRFDLPRAQMTALAPELHGTCAERLRKHQALPSAAGGALALWLSREDKL